jgi:hypothetical protein
MTRFFLALALLLSLSTLATAAPPQNPQVEAQLHALFNKWDLNHDGFLDKEELAKHFRGPKAKPPDGDMYDDKGNLTPLYYQARKKYPGLIFLWSLDKDMDGRVSWMEFEQYGQQYAAALTQRAQSQQRLLQQIYSQAYRNVRNAQYRRTNYVRNGNRYYGRQQRHVAQQYAHNVRNYQRQVVRAQGQMMRQYRYALERQRNFYRMALEQRRRWMQQYQSYLRQRMTYAHRMVARHFQAQYRRMWRR